MRDERDARRILIRIAITLDGEVAAVADDVRVGHDAAALDQESRRRCRVAGCPHSMAPCSQAGGRSR